MLPVETRLGASSALCAVGEAHRRVSDDRAWEERFERSYGFWRGLATAVVVEPGTKQPISLRVDVDVLDWFKAQGPRYQSRINAFLRSYMVQRRQDKKRRAG